MSEVQGRTEKTKQEKYIPATKACRFLLGKGRKKQRKKEEH